MMTPDALWRRRRRSTLPVAVFAGAACLMLSPALAQEQGRTAEEPETPAETPTERGSGEPTAETEFAEERAAEPRALARLDPVVVTATRRERSLFDAPAMADVVTSLDIDEHMYRTTPEALRDIPGIMVQKTGHGQGSPYIRGFTGFRNLLLIDGIRLNNSVFRDGPNQYWNTVDPYSILRLEVIKGPSSVLYGSDAIGGTVNAITKGPSTYGEGFGYGGRGYYRVSSAENSHTVRAELSTSWDHELGFYGGGSYKHYGDLISGGGRQPQTGYEEFDADFKAEYFLTPDARLIVAHQRVNQNDAWRTHRTIFGQSFEGTTVGDEQRRVLDQDRDLTYAQLHAVDLGGLVDAARFSVSFHSQSEERDRVRADGRRDIQGFDADTLGAWAQFESASPIGEWTYGVEFYRDYVDSYRRDFDAAGNLTGVGIQGPVADDAIYDLIGVYAQDDIQMNDTLNLIVGARFNYARANADEVEDPETGSRISIDQDYNSFVGSVRFVQRLDEQDRWNLFGGVSQGFRAPNLSDLTRLDTARSNEIETPSPDLDPEHFVSYELGLKTRHEDFAAQASYHYTDITDMIIRQPTGAIVDGDNEVTKRNAGDGYVQGVELEASWRFHPQFTAFGWFAWLDGEVDTFPTAAPVSVREPIDRLMPPTAQLGLRWDAPERDVWIESVLTLADEADRLSTRDESDTQRIPPGGTPGYAVLSFRGGWRINNNISLTAALENVTDEDYRIHGSGVNEPGINFVLGIEGRF